jgi:uncharacterized protein (TIGR03435 family)
LLSSVPILILIALQSSAVFGQSREFEVASIKPSDPHSTPTRTIRTSGRDVYASVTVLILMIAAYDVQNYQIAGAPSWLGNQFYEIAAKADGESTPTQAELRQMFQKLLADRFQLKIHRETRELPVYALIVGKDGPLMRESSPDTRYSRMIPGTGQWKVSKVDMARLARDLTREVGRTVVDLTGLTGYYDFTLEWTPEQASPPTADGAALPNSGGPSIFTAVQQQLGLKLESRKHPIDLLIIDHVEKPSAN